MQEILDKLGPNHTDTIGFTEVKEYNKVYALYTFENVVYVLKEGMDIPFADITELEQKEVINHFKTGSYVVDNTIQ
jgi:hypothetical protein